MARFIIRGGQAISGTFTPVGNKNAALPMMAACLLTEEPITLNNLPNIKDVRVMLELLADLGVEVNHRKHSVTLCAKNIRSGKPNPDLCRRVRGSVLVTGPLLTRVSKVTLPPPGGDVIGQRRLDAHFHGFRELGTTLKSGIPYVLSCKQLRGADMLLDEASVTATENIVMAATRAKGKTTIFHAACEPHVQDLCHLLNKMGAHIEGIGTNFLTIRGVSRLHGTSHRIAPDYIEAGSYLAAAAATGGQLTVKGMSQKGVLPILQHGFGRLGVTWELEGNNWVLPARKRFTIRDDLGLVVPKIEDGIWPSFPSDLMSVAIVLATQAHGGVLFFEKMFESRMYFVDRLIEMGAKIVQCDPHRVMVVGPARLHGSLLTSPDIRAGMALIIAALSAKGQSIIDNAQMIDRGYEDIDERLRALGADIERER
ncbi:MAG: UDP-N-acetylglucosamine 1-carboxyvinyltransferase [Kiritimatiellia bacterium]|jgi:UDP-N-acetylglucosamine 1-carboxyvinyltransferase